MEPRRPTPEEMLDRATAEQARARRGRLKIFFGAAPGVGKTYAMLASAQAARRAGLDVVIGWVDTHGRRETEALTEGLERLTPRLTEYRGVQLPELDLDAAIARRPALLIVDELAHTNAPGSRHARRWQDVEELIEAGIDVDSTLNVQHVESLNDVVAQITGVTVRETVPDSVLAGADEIELVDLPPDDLLQRLAEGKVYLPSEARRAMRNFFRKGNLIALRELALRRTAERVDDQVAQYKKQWGITQPWATRDRLLVAVGPTPQSGNLVRAAYRMAERLHAPWIALSVESSTFDRLPARDRELVGVHLELAERLGAETLVVRGEKASEEILAVARERGVTRIIIGKPTHPRWRDWVRGSVVDELVRGSGVIDVLVTTGAEDDAPLPRPAPREGGSPAADYLWALGAVVLSTVSCWVTRPIFSLADQSMIYLLGVLLVAGRFRRGPSLVAAVASVAALDFFFVPPVFTFAVTDLRYVVTFAVMLMVALMVSTRTVRMREEAESARQRERRTAALYAMSRELAARTDAAEIAAIAARHVRDLVETDAFVLLADSAGGLSAGRSAGAAAAGGSGEARGAGADPLESDRDRAVARWVFEHGRPAGFDTDTLPASDFLFLPLGGTRGVLGVFGIALRRRPAPLSPAQHQLLETFVAQTALAVERALLGAEAARARVLAETERTRSALLSAVSHDLRTPLASITGAAGALLEDRQGVGAGAGRELLETIRDEGERMGRLVGDLLDLTRLESGTLRLNKAWCPIEELVASALGRLQPRLEGRAIRTTLPSEVSLVPVDPILLEQVLINILENAAKYSPAGSPIDIAARIDGGEAVIEIADRGPGIPPGDEERLFERFYRTPHGRRVEGAGLGLAVSQAIVKAHGGRIQAENRTGGGALFRFAIPLEGAPPALDETQEGRDVGSGSGAGR